MSVKSTLLVIFILVLIIGGISLGIRQYEKQDRFQLKNISYQNINYIEVMNRGLPGRHAIYFRTKDSIGIITQQLLTASPVNVSDVNWKNNTGACEIVLHYTSTPPVAISYFELKEKGGIISSGAYHYHNNDLLQLFKSLFK